MHVLVCYLFWLKANYKTPTYNYLFTIQTKKKYQYDMHQYDQKGQI